MRIYQNPEETPERRADDLLRDMSLDEKVAQITGIFLVPAVERMAPFLKFGIGQVSTLAFRELKTGREAAELQRKVQNMAMENSPHHIPAIFHMEGICGAFIQGSTSFPSGVNRGASFDPELEKKIGEIVSRQEAAYGITQILAPVLDISRDSRMGRQSEPYGEDPTLAAAMGTAFVRGVQETETDGRHPESAAKHFLGFHASEGGVHGTEARLGHRVLDEIYGKPFQAAITEGGLKGIMPCYCLIDGLPVSASRKILTDLLRGEMGFDGVTVSDYGAVSNVHSVQGIGETLEDAGYRCLKAGMDVELPMGQAYGDGLKKLFEDGRADISYLNQAVWRVLRAKFRMGLFEHPFAMEETERELLLHRETDRQVSEQMAQESIVLLKNDGVLPLAAEKDGTLRAAGKPVRKIALIGPQAVNARYYFGGYTHLSMEEAMHAARNSMAGVRGRQESEAEIRLVPGTQVQDDESEEFDDILKLQKPDCRSLMEELRAELPDVQIDWAAGYYKAGADTSRFAEALDIAKDADLILLTLGGKNGSGSIATMGEGVDSTDINLPACQDAFIKEAASLGKPMIGVHFDGRPISSDTADEYLNALIEAFTPAEFAAQAVVHVLTGAYNPSGRMPLTTARNAGQIPVYYNHSNGSSWHQAASIGFQDYVDLPHTPRYYFGQGLSYTTFAYRDLQIEGEGGPETPVRVSCRIANTGTVKGTEVAQLYLKDPFASMARPVMELQGFARVPLEPGEEREVIFTVYPGQMAFLDEDDNWKIEKGTIQVGIGAASNDLRLTGSFEIREDLKIEGRTRKFWSDVTIQ